MRAAGLGCALACLLMAGCPAGDTCGKGRCAPDACYSALGRSPQDAHANNSGSDALYPRTDNEWWCKVDCPSRLSCGQECLEDPADSERVVCSASSVELQFQVPAKTSAFISPSLCTLVDVSSYDLEVFGSTVKSGCSPNSLCSMGTVPVGTRVPDTITISSSFGSAAVKFPYLSNATVGGSPPLLPKDTPIIVYLGTQKCP